MSQDFEAESPAPAEASRYPVLRGLGLGAKSETYLCQDSLSGRQIARKFLNPEVSAELPDVVDAYFSRWAALDHPHIVKVLDFGWEEGRAYLCTEFAEGLPIVQALTGAPLDKVWRVMGQLFLALDYLYANNAPHLDLKPKNLLVGADASGQPWLKLVDYGLMPLLYPYSPTATDSIGTPPYTAPEYALRRNPDLRADLYSVGVLLFTILARRSPYEGKDPVSLVQMQLQRDAPALKSVVAGAPVPISDFLQRLLSRNPQERFESPQQALLALQSAVGGNFPALAWPPPFSDLKQVFNEEEFLKIFRRIALQGGRWAIQAPKGSGKSFFARWLESLFWLNQKKVLRLSGETLGLVQGEVSLNPTFPTYLIIDDADLTPTEAWLRARPYGHVIALGEDMTWATKEKGWETKVLKPLESAALASVLEKNFGKVEPRVVDFVRKGWKPSPARLILAGEVLRQQGVVQREPSGWKLDSQKFLSLTSSASAANLGDPLAPFAEGPRRALGILALAKAPWRVKDLPEDGDWESWSQRGWIQRMLKGGGEYFRANFSVATPTEAGFNAGQAAETLLKVGQRGWPDAALAAFDRLLPRAGASIPEATLLYAELLSQADRHTEVLGLVNAALVQALPAEKKGSAYEIFGEALWASGKDKQAEAAFKTAFPSYKSAGDVSGQVRVLSAMGRLTRRAGDTGKALQFFQQALGAAASSPEADLLRGKVELEIAQLYVAATDFEGAEAHFQAALAALEVAGRGDALGKVYAAYAEHCLQMNDPDRSEIFCHEALGWALFHQDRPTQAKIFLIWGVILRQRDDHRAAIGHYSEAVEVLANTPHEIAYARALLARADFYDVARDLDSAQKDARAAFEIARRLKSQALEGETLLMVGKIQSHDLDKLASALKNLQAARPLLEASGNVRGLWECYFQMGECERFRAQREAARVSYQRAAQILDQLLAGIVPQTLEHEQLSKKRREIDFAMGAMG